MKAQTAIIVVFLAAAAGFALTNPELFQQIQTARIPFGTYTGPLVSAVFLAAALGVLAMYAAGAIWDYLLDRRIRRLERALVQATQIPASPQAAGEVPVIVDTSQEDIARRIEEVSQGMEAIRIELSEQIVELGRVLEDRVRREDSRRPVTYQPASSNGASGEVHAPAATEPAAGTPAANEAQAETVTQESAGTPTAGSRE